VRYIRDWNYMPKPPYVVQAIHTGSLGEQFNESHASLATTVRRFIEEWLPVEWNMMVTILDRDERVLLQYFAKGDMDYEQWWGCAATFDLLAQFQAAHPVDMAGWETRAREALVP
jgi:hypothetical protein